MKTIQTLIVVSVCACSFIAPTRSRSAEAQADSSTTAPPVVTPADKVRMAQAARVDCYAQLVEQIKGLKVSDNSTVLDAASQYFEQMANSSGFVQGAALGPPVYQGDTCLIKAELTLDQIVENLTRSVTVIDNKIKNEFESIKRFNKLIPVKVTGMGALAAPETPDTAEISPKNTGELETIKNLLGPGQYKIMAMKAARLNALVNLAASIKGVRVSSVMSVRNCVGSSWQQADTEAVIQGARVVRYAAVEPGLVQCWMEINLDTLVENIQKNGTLFSNGKDVSVENIKRYNKLQKVVGIGQGAVMKPGATEEPVETSTLPGSVR